MTNQQIVALGQIWPNGNAKAIEATIEFIRDEKPDRVIATTGATEGFLRALRDSYDGWAGAHLTRADLCDAYGVEQLGELYDFAPNWTSYSGRLADATHPDSRPLLTARKLGKSIVTGATHRVSCSSYTMVSKPGGTVLSSVTAVGVGHLCLDKQWPDGHISVGLLTVHDERVETTFLSYSKGSLVRPAPVR